MIQIHRNHPSTNDTRIKIVGLGGAGGNVLDRLLLDGADDAELVAINTDVQSLTASVVAEKVQLGRATTRGLGAGGDPEVGYAAAEEGIEEIRRSLEGAQMVFLCVGLGGGTGSGAARIVASVAREHNALVIAFATLPFAFEGKRRRAQAEEALGALQRYADVVIHFENDRMGDAVSPLAGIQEAFAAADQTLSQSIRAIVGLVRRRGFVHIGFDELATALRAAGESGAHCVFGHGEADGDNRAHEALARALKNPLMDKGRMLEGARNVLVNVAGGPGMTLNEVQILMEELNRHISDQTRLLFGAAVDPALGQKMTVTILSALQGEAPAVVEARPRATTRTESSPASIPPTAPSIPSRVSEPAPVLRVVEKEPEPVYLEPVAARAASVETVRPVVEVDESAELIETESARVAAVATKAAARAKAVQAKQEQMQFEPVTRGRFEKSEPTIVDGQDLDVPTFLRRNVKVK
jgi:cell division protein FtsZ